MSSSRIPITRFGMQLGIESTLKAWYAARDRHELHVEFKGTQKVRELGDLPVWEFVRDDYTKPEDDGIMEATYYIDPRTQLQVGTILRDKDGELIGSYFFRDLQLNPTFPPDTFTLQGLKKN